MELNEANFALKIKTQDEVTPEVLTRLAGFACIGLNRIFGEDRFEIWSEGKRFVFDAKAQDGEHYGHDVVGKWTEA